MKSSVSESKPFQSCSKGEILAGLGKAKRTGEPFQIETGIPNNILIQTLNFSCTQFKVLGLAHEKFGV